MSVSRSATPVSSEAVSRARRRKQALSGLARSTVSSPATFCVTPEKSCSVLLASKPTRERLGTIASRWRPANENDCEGSWKERKVFFGASGAGAGVNSTGDSTAGGRLARRSDSARSTCAAGDGSRPAFELDSLARASTAEAASSFNWHAHLRQIAVAARARER
jgi:hypothetical protein